MGRGPEELDLKHRNTGYVRAAVLALGLCGALSAQAEDWGRYGGGSVGSSDYGTAAKLMLGTQIHPLGAIEGQVLSFGSETYQEFGNSYKRSASALGLSGVAQLPMSSSLRAFGKLGLNYLSSKATGPGLDDKKNSTKLGLGAGLVWMASTDFGLRAEFENIGGSGGDVISLGLQFRF